MFRKNVLQKWIGHFFRSRQSGIFSVSVLIFLFFAFFVRTETKIIVFYFFLLKLKSRETTSIQTELDSFFKKPYKNFSKSYELAASTNVHEFCYCTFWALNYQHQSKLNTLWLFFSSESDQWHKLFTILIHSWTKFINNFSHRACLVFVFCSFCHNRGEMVFGHAGWRHFFSRECRGHISSVTNCGKIYYFCETLEILKLDSY